MKPLLSPILLLAVGLQVSAVSASEYLVERRPDVSTLAHLESLPDIQVLRSFEAFGKTYDVVVAPSLGAFVSRAAAPLARTLWKKIEPNHSYMLLMGAAEPAAPSKPDDLSDFVPRPLLPNDTLFNSLWGLLNYGQDLAQKGRRHMDAAVAQAWTLHRGSRNVVVGVVDTGVDYRHSDLRANLWSTTNSRGKLSFGWDALNQDDDPMDGHRHGTHVAGTIGAVGNNGIGVTGVNWTSRMASVQIFDAKGATSSDAILRALDWLYRQRDEIRVVNHSWGGDGYSAILQEAFTKLDNDGVINVFAAGNDSARLKAEDVGKDAGFYPAMFPLKNSIVVASFNNQGQRSTFSNYGPDLVDLAAPGEEIYSTVPKGAYKRLSGTSMAAPHVTGAVALLMSYRPELSPKQVKEHILGFADETPSLMSTSFRGRRLNVYRALLGRN